MTNGTNKVLDLTKVLDVGSIDMATLNVSVQACNPDGTVVWDSGTIANGTTLTADLDIDHPEDWKATVPAQSAKTKIWAGYNVAGSAANLSIDGVAISYFYNRGCFI